MLDLECNILLCSNREARCSEASLVWGGASRSWGAPNAKHQRAQSPSKSRLRALPAAVPPSGQQPPRLASHQVLLPQPHPAAQEKPATWKWPPATHCLLREGGGGERRGQAWCRFLNGSQLPMKCTTFEKTVQNFIELLSFLDTVSDSTMIWVSNFFCCSTLRSLKTH